MTIQAPTSFFQANWTSVNSHLRVYPPTRFQKVCRVVWDIISVLIPVILIARMIGWAVASLCKKVTLPSADFYSPQQLQEMRDLFDIHCFGAITHENRAQRQVYTVQRHAVLTPDNARLNVIQFRHRDADQNTPTILYFQPNLALSEHFIHSWLLQEAIRRGTRCNFLVFDYRSVSFSNGDLKRPEQLIVDGDSVYQFAIQRLGIPPHLIKMYGWSLGGSVSANIKALHPECDTPYVNERSFSSLLDVVLAWLKTMMKKLFLFWLPLSMRAIKWDLKTPIDRVRGPIMIVYHPDDSLIGYEGSCHQLAIRTRTVFESIRLKANSFLRHAEITGYRVHHHSHPLQHYVVAERGNRPADQIIADFILGPAQEAVLPQQPQVINVAAG